MNCIDRLRTAATDFRYIGHATSDQVDYVLNILLFSDTCNRILWMIYQSIQHALQRHPQEVALAVAATVGRVSRLFDRIQFEHIHQDKIFFNDLYRDPM